MALTSCNTESPELTASLRGAWGVDFEQSEGLPKETFLSEDFLFDGRDRVYVPKLGLKYVPERLEYRCFLTRDGKIIKIGGRHPFSAEYNLLGEIEGSDFAIGKQLTLRSTEMTIVVYRVR